MITSSAITPTVPAYQVPYLTTGQVARRLGLHRETVRRSCVEGKIPAYQIDDGTEWRIPRSWVEEKERQGRGKIIRRGPK